jgi:hypothetical protein
MWNYQFAEIPRMDPLSGWEATAWRWKAAASAPSSGDTLVQGSIAIGHAYDRMMIPSSKTTSTTFKVVYVTNLVVDDNRVTATTVDGPLTGIITASGAIQTPDFLYVPWNQVMHVSNRMRRESIENWAQRVARNGSRPMDRYRSMGEPPPVYPISASSASMSIASMHSEKPSVVHVHEAPIEDDELPTVDIVMSLSEATNLWESIRDSNTSVRSERALLMAKGYAIRGFLRGYITADPTDHRVRSWISEIETRITAWKGTRP